MSERVVIDGLQFARDRGRLEGHADLAEMSRVAELGALDAGVDYRVEGIELRLEGGERGPGLRIAAQGSLNLVCQRCLDLLAHPIDISIELELTTDPLEAETADDEVDRVLATRSMDVCALVEDEVILDLPMVPMHPSCEARQPKDGADASPFAVLADLKRR